MTKEQRTEIDEKVFCIIVSGNVVFATIHSAMCVAGAWPSGNEVDKSLQRLRRKGRIRFCKADRQWRVVETEQQKPGNAETARHVLPSCRQQDVLHFDWRRRWQSNGTA